MERLEPTGFQAAYYTQAEGALDFGWLDFGPPVKGVLD